MVFRKGLKFSATGERERSLLFAGVPSPKQAKEAVDPSLDLVGSLRMKRKNK